MRALVRPRALVVDDEPLLLRSFARLLRRMPVDLATAGSAEEALELLEAGPFDLVISDQGLPGLAGVDLLAIVRERWPAVVRVLLTGQGMPDALLAQAEAGAFVLLTKPCEPEALRALVQGLPPGDADD